jgi:hypothetical protein
MRLAHARHNETACQHLKNSGLFNDWVITTAFYSAIHFIDHELFPKQYEDPQTGRPRTFNDFESYYNRTDRSVNKHQLRHNLVDEYIPEVSDQYQTLKENCWTARYVNYRVDPLISDECFFCLQQIKEICEPVS